MGRPKIKVMDNALDIEKVKLEEPQELPELSGNAEEKLTKDLKTATASKKSSGKEKPSKYTRSKRFLESEKLIEKGKEYTLSEAVDLVKKTSKVKFDAAIEAHINLRIDPEKQEQQMRTTTQLPHGTGKKVRILVFGAKDSKAIKDLGAEVGTEDTLGEIEKGKISFDKVVATPDWMPKLARVAKVLGPKGLMPNPKSGTVTPDPEKTVSGLGSGLVEIKTENSPIIHVGVGKVSFKETELEANVKALVEAVKAAKPSEVKKELVKSVYLTSSMGPSVKIDLASLKS
jgi:large subunit ribosomal protein L1